MIEDSERDEACKPEEHGDRIEHEVAYGVGDLGSEFGDEDEEEDDEESPDGGENEEGVSVLEWRVSAVGVFEEGDGAGCWAYSEGVLSYDATMEMVSEGRWCGVAPTTYCAL